MVSSIVLAVLVVAVALGSQPASAAPAPALTISAPAEGAVTDEPSVEVSGNTDPGAVVVVNGYSVAVDGAGNFSILLALRPGANQVNVTSAAGPGATTTLALNVTFDDPVPELREQLLATQSQLADTQEALALAQIQGGRTHNTLVNTTGTVEALSGQVAMLSIVAAASLLGALGAIGLTVVQAGRMENGKGKPGQKKDD